MATTVTAAAVVPSGWNHPATLSQRAASRMGRCRRRSCPLVAFLERREAWLLLLLMLVMLIQPSFSSKDHTAPSSARVRSHASNVSFRSFRGGSIVLALTEN